MGVFEATSFSRGYIFYDNENGSIDSNNLWEKLRLSEIKYGRAELNWFTSEASNKNQMILRGAEALNQLGEDEQDKEIALLHTLVPNLEISKDNSSYIQIFNEIYRGKDEFKKSVLRIQAALNADKQLKLRAPSLIVHYPDYFASALRDKISNALKTETNRERLILKDQTLWSSLVDRAINDAFIKLESAVDGKQSDIYGRGEDFKGIGDLLSKNLFFKELIETELHISNVQNYIQDFIQNNMQPLNKKLGKKPRRKSLTIKDIKDEMGLSEGRVRSVAGLVDEYAKSAVQEAILNSSQSNPNIKASGDVIRNRTNASDTFQLIYETDTDISPIIEDLNNAFNDSKQSNIAQNLQNFVKRWEDPNNNIDKLFLVSTSNKLYSMSHNHPFSKQAKVADLRSILKDKFTSTLGGSYAEVNMFANSTDTTRIVNLIYNTMKGAFLNSEKKQVIQSLKDYLAMGAASLIFSDFYSVGDAYSDTLNMIHLFDLNGVYIPLSVILKGMAKAYQKGTKTQEYLSITGFNTGSILYPAGHQDRYKIDAGENENIRAAFRAQREKAKEQAVFNIHFVNNFKQVIAELKV